MDFRVRSGPSPLKRRAQDGRCDSRCEIPYSPPPIDGSESPVCKAFRVFLCQNVWVHLGTLVWRIVRVLMWRGSQSMENQEFVLPKKKGPSCTGVKAGINSI